MELITLTPQSNIADVITHFLQLDEQGLTFNPDTQAHDCLRGKGLSPVALGQIDANNRIARQICAKEGVDSFGIYIDVHDSDEPAREIKAENYVK